MSTSDSTKTNIATADITVSDLTVSDFTVSNFTVSGMTCGHCVAAVTGELSKLQGVTSVDVVLQTGAVSVHSTSPIDRQAVAEAVDEAGYALEP